VRPRPDDPLVKDRSLLKLIGDWRKFPRESDNQEIEIVRASTRTERTAGTKEFL
jgi:hypothetical protein